MERQEGRSGQGDSQGVQAPARTQTHTQGVPVYLDTLTVASGLPVAMPICP